MNVCDKTAENGFDVDEVYTGVHVMIKVLA